MYLSKITLRQSGQTANILAKLGANGVYTSHQLLWKLFSEDVQRQFLFRQEIGIVGLPVFYVLSKTSPQMQSPLFDVKTKSFYPLLHEGQRLAFKLRVNPTICVTDTSGKRRRHDVLMHAKFQARRQGEIEQGKIKVMMEDAARNWLLDNRRMQQWGIQFDDLLNIEGYTQHRSVKKKGQKIQFSSVDFQGLLTITNGDLFLAQYARGFGRSKAMGCGLMLIRTV
ncbi:type I-E CRISPR-associated protein Cas6/Cse3/CasE [Photorhabdus khanii]|uniref:Type I-E CRISPR-associated protein Cas6/Cse3/CasE n=1 Tax=Photorhabdus khanii subsp. guanajuatensis TaxID=2100166 RepID=A0A4V2X5A9_9GAMM|nr:type I-E CRISPR-associated protein Cas6/Cse3/CasE [Photorhabdus khanii]TDB47495.1 type I-E CRISPR-associated protein Cas6/Cse3/CasE [Photorhabdus khanii subsp. guanajuatensis]